MTRCNLYDITLMTCIKGSSVYGAHMKCFFDNKIIMGLTQKEKALSVIKKILEEILQRRKKFFILISQRERTECRCVKTGSFMERKL